MNEQSEKPEKLSEDELEKLDQKMWQWHMTDEKGAPPQMDENTFHQLRRYQHDRMMRSIDEPV